MKERKRTFGGGDQRSGGLAAVEAFAKDELELKLVAVISNAR